METKYDHKLVEDKIYHMWESGGFFTPKIDKSKKPFTIVLPPPNANAALHLGHAMYTVEDILIRWHRMMGDPTLWLPGADHAGFETQVVYEKQLSKEGKSRFDFKREDLYQNIWDFVQANKSTMQNQLRKLGFSLDWTREKFTLDQQIINTTYKTFEKLWEDKLLYRDSRLVNYCTKHGTGFSDLEVEHVEQTDPLYYMKYGPFVLATVRPETKFGDTAVAVNPNDKRFQKWVDQEIEVEGLLGKFKVKVIADEEIDPNFGTGIAKVTPAHDFKDFDMGKRHNLEMKQVIGLDGKLTSLAGPYAGMKVKEAREKVAADLEAKGLMDHVDRNYVHTVATCYKCGSVLEPLPIPQWYIKTKLLAQKAVEAVENKETTIIPERFNKVYFDWMDKIRDWNISRQVVWGIRIPAWQCQDCHEWTVSEGGIPTSCVKCQSNRLVQDTDTFDTWFSSGQWPFATLGYPDSDDYKNFYPISVMETAYDILFFWVARMIMLGIYVTGKSPFKYVYLHGLVRDSKGQKMSKSKGNVVNPMDLVEKYGADAVRFALMYTVGPGADQNLSEDKIRAMRNFTNKLWNMARFILTDETKIDLKGQSKKDQDLLVTTKTMVDTVNKQLTNFDLGMAADYLYDFTWHTFADDWIECYKKGEISYRTLLDCFLQTIKLLHPFMPFVTEEIWSLLPHNEKTPLIISSWPM